MAFFCFYNISTFPCLEKYFLIYRSNPLPLSLSFFLPEPWICLCHFIISAIFRFGHARWLSGKEYTSAGESEDAGSIPGSGKSPGGGNGNPLQYSCLENSMDRGDWRATVQGVTEHWTRLSNWALFKFIRLTIKQPSGSSVHGILQARILEWVAMHSSRGSSWPRDWTHVSYVSCIGRGVLYH